MTLHIVALRYNVCDTGWQEREARMLQFMADSGGMLVEMENAGVRRSGRWLVRGVDLAVRRGEIVTLIGPNGSGKSTTAKIAIGVLKPDEGTVRRKRTLKVGYVPQKVTVDWTLPLTIERLMRLTGPLEDAQIAEALAAVGIAHLARAEVQRLSGGEFQRALVARALARQPDLLVLDEPVQGVDFSGEIALYQLIREIRDRTGCGILLISHDLHVVMAETDTVICLNGHVCCRGTPENVIRSRNICVCSARGQARRLPSIATITITRVLPMAACGWQTAPSPIIATLLAIRGWRNRWRRSTMLDDFFTRALVAGIGLALVAGPLRCFVVWRRMAYFGDTMAHSALLGVALSFLFEINLMAGVFIIAALASLALLFLQRQGALSTDALLGILSHSTLALGLVMVAFMSWIRIDLMGFLFGDILAVSRLDIAMIYGGGALVLAVLAWLWRPLLTATVNPEIAEAEGLRPERARFVFMLLMAAIIAIAMKIVGILLITSLLIIPAAAGRRFAATPEIMAVAASIAGTLAVVGGLSASLHFDTPSGPSIVVAALCLFLVSLVRAPQWQRSE